MAASIATTRDAQIWEVARYALLGVARVLGLTQVAVGRIEVAVEGLAMILRDADGRVLTVRRADYVTDGADTWLGLHVVVDMDGVDLVLHYVPADIAEGFAPVLDAVHEHYASVATEPLMEPDEY